MKRMRNRFLVVLVLFIFVGSLLFQVESTAAWSGDSEAPLSTASVDYGIAQGVHLRPTYYYGSEVGAFNSLVGKNVGLLMYFTPWSPFDPFLLDKLQEDLPSDAVPTIILSWEPGPSSTGCDLGYGGVGPLTAINLGNCDNYIRSFATTLKARPERFILRIGHEMNIADSPWWPGHYGSTSAQFVAMWRHIYDIVESVNPENIEFVWSPNYASNPLNDDTYAWNDLHNYYPGDAYVDWIGLSGYNWGNPWRTFEEIYDEVLRDLTCSYAKPQLLLEIGSVEGSGGSQTKAHWLTDMYSKLPNYPFVRGVVWFNDFAYARRGQADFRVTTSTSDCTQYGDCSGVMPLSNWTTAYASSMTDSVYEDFLPSAEDAKPSRVMCGVLEDQLTVSPSRALVARGNAARFTVSAYGISDPIHLEFDPSDGAYLGFPLGTMYLTSVSSWDTIDFLVESYSTTPLGSYEFSVEAGGHLVALSITVVDEIQHVYLPSVFGSQ